MFNDVIALDGATGTEASFKLISQSNGESKRIASSTTLAEPTLLVVKHTTTGAGSRAVDRHLVQLSMTKNDASGQPHLATVNVTLAIPRSTVQNTDVRNLVAYAIDFLSGGGFSDTGLANTDNLDGLLIGEN